MHEPRSQITLIGRVAGGEFLRALIKVIQFPLRRRGIHPWKPGKRKHGTAAWNDETQSFVKPATVAAFAAVMKPKDTKGKNAVDHALRLGRADPDNSPGLMATHLRAPRVGRAEGTLKIHRRAKPVAVPILKLARQHTL